MELQTNVNQRATSDLYPPPSSSTHQRNVDHDAPSLIRVSHGQNHRANHPNPHIKILMEENFLFVRVLLLREQN